MRNILNLILFLILLVIVRDCTNSISTTDLPSERITVAPGPEDMVLDTLHREARLLISCSGRRDQHTPYGEILSLDLSEYNPVEMERIGEPDTLLFRPHGIYLEGDRLLVISHEREPDIHPILIYRRVSPLTLYMRMG